MSDRASIEKLLTRARVVPAVRDGARLNEALAGGSPLVIVFSPLLDTVQEMVARARAAGALLLVHADMMEGIASDAAGLGFLARCGVAGVATTRTQTMTLARQANLLVTFRAFLIDSAALMTVAKIVERNSPDIVEALPAPVLPHLPPGFIARLGVPILAGGLVQTQGDVAAAIAAGAAAVSTTRDELWPRPGSA